MRRTRGRWLALGATLATVAGVVAIAATSAPDRRPGGSAGTNASDAPRASGGPVATGPRVYYEILDAAGSRLMERRLDGHSLPRLVAERTDADYGRTWTVDPAGTIAISAIPGRDDQRLEAIAVATGASLWSSSGPLGAVDGAIWSADGQRLAMPASGGDSGPAAVLVVEARTGQIRRVTVPDDAVIQGFGADAALVLRRHVVSPDGVDAGWSFLRVEPGAAAATPMTGLPDVGPATAWSEDVDPGAGLAVDQALGPNDVGTAVRAVPLGGGAPRTLATLPSIDKVAIDPAGTGVAVSAGSEIRFIGFGGGASSLYGGPDPVTDFAWSADGDYLAVATDRGGPGLTVVERATGRAVELPPQGTVAQLLFVRLVGGVALPADPLPAVEPTPTPTQGPAGEDVAGFGGILSGWVDRSGSSQVAHVERLVPTEGGGTRIAAAMPPLDLGPAAVPDDGGPMLRILPRPGSADTLVWVWTADRASGWLWDGADGLRPLPLPADWPASAFDVAWSPDGRSLAGTAGRATRNGFEDVFVIASIGAVRTRVVPIVGDYDRLEGWWSATELRVGHGICTEGCAGHYAYDARLRIRDHRLVQMTPADRAHGAIDEIGFDGSAIVLSMVNEDAADDVAIDWPVALGSIDAVEPIGFAADGRTLLLAVATATGTDLVRIADPIGRAVGGRLADPEPVTLAHLAGRGLRIDVSPDQAWAAVTDRVDDLHLIRLADGRSWPIDRDRILVWPDGS